MTPILGNYILALTVLVAVAGLFSSIASIRFGSTRILRWAKWAILTMAGLMTAASALLLYAELTSDFRLEYVVNYTERALPIGYKIAAFWAGQSGSLLLWSLMMIVMSALAVLRHWNRSSTYHTAMVSTLAIVNGFFAALLLFAANPFELVPNAVPNDGNGLNPMLQDPSMIAHPPLLFMGYAGCLVPFAFMIGALFANRVDSKWLLDIRRWIITSWVFLTAGIVLGSWWAYVELGWGGYWAWDPVENASLLPWLALTALMHSIMVQQHRGMAKRWNVALIAMSFILCIVGTYITRSGVISSVHAFGESLVGDLFFGFLAATILVSVALFIWRYRALRPEHELESVVGAEGAFMVGNILLVLMTVATLTGTLFPLITRKFGFDEVTPTAGFYNRAILPLAIILIAIMAFGPILVYGRDAASRLKQRAPWPIIVGLALMVVLFALGIRSLWALSAAVVIGIGTVAVVLDFIRSISSRRRNTNEGPVSAVIRLIDSNHRRYGGQLAHVGTMMVVIGVVGSAVFGTKKIIQLSTGEQETVAGYTIRFDGMVSSDGPNYRGAESALTITDPRGGEFALGPEIRKYEKWSEDNREVSLRIGVIRDFYVTLLGWEDGGNLIGLEVHVNPLISWIWIGSIVMVFGGVFAIMPRLVPRTSVVPAPEASPVAPGQGRSPGRRQHATAPVAVARKRERETEAVQV